ncbi:urocanate hydratase [Ixodes scapularis]
MSTLKEICGGLPLDPLPPKKRRDEALPHAPVRNVPLTLEEKQVALKNALRYFPARVHAVLAPEFAEELSTYGHIYMYRFLPSIPMRAYPISEYPAKSQQAAAVMLMIMNNLDPQVAQFPQELVTYGGNGQVFSNWAQFWLVMHYLSKMNESQTLVMYSGHPLGLFPSLKPSPRVVITNGMVIPSHSTPPDYDKMFAMGVSMYGQMTAGSYCYIGPQGIVHGTTITIMNAGRKYLKIDDLRGKEICGGLPLDPLPPKKRRDEALPHAPVRNVPLTLEEKQVALKNALRYFPARVHAVLAPEFAEELSTYGHIYMYRFLPSIPMRAYPISEYPAKSQQAAAVMLMIMNNLDPQVAQFPQELVTYGGNGQVFSNWAQFWLVMHYLSKMNESQTLVMYSGHPLGLFPSLKPSPRVVITNGMVIPSHSTPPDYDKMFAMGVSMYGQMTAGSYCYIGPQGIVHGTTITIMNAGRKYLKIDDLRGKHVLRKQQPKLRARTLSPHFRPRSTLSQLAMQGGHSSVNCCLAGAFLGCRDGFSALPNSWVQGLLPKQRQWLNERANSLLDKMGLP